MKVLNMGGGVNTVALLLEYWKDYDLVLFSDTGGENPETYFYLENYIIPFCKSKNLEFVKVQSKLGTLEQYCLDKKQIPSRKFKWCTDKFKRTPIKQELRRRGATAKNPITCSLGICSDESHRINTKYDNVKYQILDYPLIDHKITRRDCIEIIKKHGFPVPTKSACYYCYNSSKKEILKLRGNHKDLFDKMETMESNSTRTFFNVPLKHYNEIQTLDDFGCDSGHCFN